jgi:hypothetical protein
MKFRDYVIGKPRKLEIKNDIHSTGLELRIVVSVQNSSEGDYSILLTVVCSSKKLFTEGSEWLVAEAKRFVLLKQCDIQFAISRLLTGYLEALLREDYMKKHLQILTPTDVKARGSQLSLKFDSSWPVKEIHNRLKALGVICDVREPNAMRIAPAPLYNTFSEVLRFVTLLRQVRAPMNPLRFWRLHQDRLAS